MALEPFETQEAHGFPTVTQLSTFIENRVGQLLNLTRALDESDVHILALSIVNGVDCAVIRMIVDHPDSGATTLRAHRFPTTENDLLVVCLKPGKRGLLDIWMALMAGEVSIHYTYPLLIRPNQAPAIALQADSNEMATHVLRDKGFALLDQQDLTGYATDFGAND